MTPKMPDPMPVPDSLRQLYDGSNLADESARIAKEIQDHLKRCSSSEPYAVMPWTEPDEMLDRWPADFSEASTGSVGDLASEVLHQSARLHLPGYCGHQVAVTIPPIAMLESVMAILNNGMGVYEMGMVGTAMELNSVRWMARQLGFENADGHLTLGGTLGNLTCLLAAKKAAEESGPIAHEKLAVIASESAHFSIARVVRVMGLGADAIMTVGVDESLRMKPESLAKALEQADAEGRKVLAVVSNACCTATGCFDPLIEIAKICNEQNVWLHIDGAHGASACLSKKHRTKLAGIERADSVVWDAHKLMMVPANCTAVIFRDPKYCETVFDDEASYLYDDPKREDWYNLSHRTFECTKPMIALRLYAALKCFGTKVFEDYIDYTFGLASRFARIITDAEDFELFAEPESNIVCFRQNPAGTADVNELQSTIRNRVIKEGKFYIVQTSINGNLYLRCTFMNPMTSEADLKNLIAHIRKVGEDA